MHISAWYSGAALGHQKIVAARFSLQIRHRVFGNYSNLLALNI